MVEAGTTPHQYEPYHSVTRTIDLQGNQLRSLPDGTHDELVVHRDGSVELVQRVYWFRVLGSDIAWSGIAYGKRSAAVRYPNTVVPPTSDNTNNKLYSTHFKHYSVSVVGSLRGEITSAGYYLIHHLMDKDEYTSLDEVKAFFDENEVYEAIALATPATITLPSIDPLPTYHPTTVITADGVDVTAKVKVID